ncbi:IclR family transcriptional regulator [Jeotgalibaca sp. MA1X17-3]|uniref:IclR family transcriptional regulator n=1 Tax=Jeotgalibaca sp. MA1X17-3 TaxID=2908211 RepID=UPI001F379115|nr:IclR family transcriptional regulator [Jeotgalibaca sp. MA1X17-3]UJF15724.1 IclR family transcriptional regulator [Jeotgalibaca sp. MA1X17-3]
MSNAALRTSYILDIVSKHDKGVTLSEIAQELGAPISSVNDIVRALVHTEMLELLDEKSKVYGVGIKSFLIGQRYINNTNILEKAVPIIDSLSSTLNKTVFFGRSVNEKLTYIYKSEPDEIVSSTCSIGSQTSLHTTSLGKAIMAYNDQLAEDILNRNLLKKTEFSIIDPQELRDELAKIRLQGYAVDDRENDSRLFCVGAPIFDIDGTVTTAISISGLVDDNRDIEYEVNLIKEKAKIISQKMGYTGRFQ